MSEAEKELAKARAEAAKIVEDARKKAGVMLREAQGTIDEITTELRDIQHRKKDAGFNEDQRAMLNRLLDGFTGNLTSTKWAKIRKVSQDTATREINDLLARGVLVRRGRARATHYELVPDPATP